MYHGVIDLPQAHHYFRDIRSALFGKTGSFAVSILATYSLETSKFVFPKDDHPGQLLGIHRQTAREHRPCQSEPHDHTAGRCQGGQTAAEQERFRSPERQ